MVPTEDGPSALKVKIHNSFVDESVWLWMDDAKMGATQMGPAKVVFSHQKIQETQGAESPLGYLELELDGATYRIPVPENTKFPKTISVEGTKTKTEIEILNFYRNAAVSGTQLIEQDPLLSPPGLTGGSKSDQKPMDSRLRGNDNEQAAGKNPALRLFLRVNGREELHTVFAKFPDF